MRPEKPGIFLCNGTVGRCHFLGSWLAPKEHRYDRGGRGRRQQRGTDHITQQKIHYITHINSRENLFHYVYVIDYITNVNSPKIFSVCNDLGANSTILDGNCRCLIPQNSPHIHHMQLFHLLIPEAFACIFTSGIAW